MLTVKELINKLGQYPDDMPVIVHAVPDGNYPNFSAEIDEIYDTEQTVKSTTYLGGGDYRVNEEVRKVVALDANEF